MRGLFGTVAVLAKGACGRALRAYPVLRENMARYLQRSLTQSLTRVFIHSSLHVGPPQSMCRKAVLPAHVYPMAYSPFCGGPTETGRKAT